MSYLKYKNKDPRCTFPFTNSVLGYCWQYAKFVDKKKENIEEFCKGCKYWKEANLKHQFNLKVPFPIEVIIERDGKDWHGYSPELKGLHVHGNTFALTVSYLEDGVIAYLENFIREYQEKETKKWP